MNGQELPSFREVLRDSMTGKHKSKRVSEKKEDYEEVKKRVMASREPDDKDYNQLSYDDRDEWVHKHYPNLGF